MRFKGELEGYVCGLVQAVLWSNQSRTLFGRTGPVWPCEDWLLVKFGFHSRVCYSFFLDSVLSILRRLSVSLWRKAKRCIHPAHTVYHCTHHSLNLAQENSDRAKIKPAQLADTNIKLVYLMWISAGLNFWAGQIVVTNWFKWQTWLLSSRPTWSLKLNWCSAGQAEVLSLFFRICDWQASWWAFLIKLIPRCLFRCWGLFSVCMHIYFLRTCISVRILLSGHF
jgi:hypothetical protein